jgi:hypothetical protein
MVIKKSIKEIKKSLKISDRELAEMFGYKNLMSYRNSTGKKHIEKGLEVFYSMVLKD